MNASVHSVPDEPVEPSGLPAETVDALFSSLASFSTLALGVSGGADSLCLLVLFSEWRQRANWRGDAEVLVVDHGLRPESSDEARFVFEAAARNGLPAKIILWDEPSPTSNVQEAARQARYRLMAHRMNETGAEALLLAHHLDDQVETFLDRLTRGSGVSGLSAMVKDTADGPEGMRLLRPFLGVRKNRLEAALRERGLTWCTDPSNIDPKYKRSRLRRIMDLLEEEGLSAERLAETAAHMRRSREALEATVSDVAARKVEHHPAGPARIARETYKKLAEDLRLRLLVVLITDVTGRPSRPRFHKVQALDAALVSGDAVHQSLSGALFAADENSVWCWREPGRNPPETVRDLGAGGDWDDRYTFSLLPDTALADVADLKLGPLQSAPVRSRDVVWPEGWPKAAFDCSPMVWSEDGKTYTNPVSLPTRLEENNHINGLDLARVPIRGKLKASNGDEENFCGEF
ncbi:tRNA lysidine(34) synthetase TilS [Roseibium sp. MMSF_3544]|uniref:tRNA lysidine(34) synthetase TilS n=1 Tax=unclassified Roseibium TaxID=2629323 RepID=UPI00273E5CCB|nr:tRNA lysidine(34) synthetase TilS [Roseibium sp. MMSF_3544]